jgi:uncharacterized metal-binding protein YceD (DUF177 family)
MMKEFLIPFVGLKLGKHRFDYQINNKFFQEFDYHQFEDASITVELVFEKKATLLELSFKHLGSVNVPCDVTGEQFDLPIKGKLNLVVQFGEEYNDDNEELLVLPHGEYQVNVAQYIYEMIVLSVPLKRIHPGVKDGSIDVSNYERYITYEQPKEQKEEVDPRWAKLKDLLKDNKDNNK